MKPSIIHDEQIYYYLTGRNDCLFGRSGGTPDVIRFRLGEDRSVKGDLVASVLTSKIVMERVRGLNGTPHASRAGLTVAICRRPGRRDL